MEGLAGNHGRPQDKDEEEEEEAATVGEKLHCGNMRVGGAKLRASVKSVKKYDDDTM